MLRSYCKQDALVVALDGELDHFCAQSVRSQLDEMLADSSVRYLVLDFDKLTFMDSSGIGMLLGRLRALQARGGSLSVMHMQPPVEKLFRLSGLDRVIGVEDDIRGGRL